MRLGGVRKICETHSKTLRVGRPVLGLCPMFVPSDGCLKECQDPQALEKLNLGM